MQIIKVLSYKKLHSVIQTVQNQLNQIRLSLFQQKKGLLKEKY
jgi:hypothetical protein